MSLFRDPSSTHKTMRQKLERLENTVSAIPQTLNEYLDSFNAYCVSGIKLASLLQTLFQETPVLLMALRYGEAYEQLHDKSSKSGVVVQQEIVGPIKRISPALSKLRSRLDSHAKALSKYESYLKQLEQLQLSQNPNKQKMEQVENKFHSSAEEFAKEDALLAEALNELHKLRVEVMGSCFLSLLESQAKLLSTASDIIAPLGAYKEVGKGLSESPSSSLVKEATVGWLSAAQVNQNLRSFGSLSRNDVQCMMYSSSDGLPDTIRNGLNAKVNQMLKTYASELQKAPNPHHKVTGGFHLNPKGIELALRDCCSDLESKGAGAPHAQTKAEMEEQIARDVPRTSYCIGSSSFGCAMGDQMGKNVEQKKAAIMELISGLLPSSQLEMGRERVADFAFHVLNESCTTVTNTAAKTAVQLIFGKANLVLVKPAPTSQDNKPIEITARPSDSSIQIAVHSSWWLVEDYAAFAMLARTVDPSALLGAVDVTYTVNHKLKNFLNEETSTELPSIAVTYRQPTSAYSPNLSSGHKDKSKFLSLDKTLRTIFRPSRSPSHSSNHQNSPRRQPSFQSYVEGHKSSHTSESEGLMDEKLSSGGSSRKVSSDSDSTGEVTITVSSAGIGKGYGRNDSLERKMRPSYHHHRMYERTNLRRTGSSETVSSQSTLVQPRDYDMDDSSMAITDFLHSNIGKQSLTESRVHAQERLYERRPRNLYEYRGRKEMFAPGKERREETEELQNVPEESGHSQENGLVNPRDQVYIATDSEQWNAIDFLSRGRSPFPSSESPYDEYEGSSRHQPEDFTPYSSRYDYPRNYRTGYDERSRYDNWEREPSGRNERPGGSENSSSGSSGIDDPFGRGEQYPLRSRSGSASSFHNEHEGHNEGELRHNPNPGPTMDGLISGMGMGEGGTEASKPQSGSKASLVSIDSGIHLVHPSGKKIVMGDRGGGGERNYPTDFPVANLPDVRPDRELESRQLQDLPFSKGLGPFITTDSHMDILRDGSSFLYKSDSDSEHSGRDSIPPILSSSSGSQSPLLFRTRSEENIRVTERSSSRASTHSMPYTNHQGGSTLSLDERDFNQAPGSRPRPGPGPGAYDYGDRLSQDSDGGRGSLSQGSIGSRDPWEMEYQMRQRREREQYRPFDAPLPPHRYEGPPPPFPDRSRSLQRGMRGRSHDDYSPSPGPPPHEFDRRPPMMPPGPGYWPGYEPPSRMRPNSGGPPMQNPPPPHPHGPSPGPPPPGPHPMHDNRFRPVHFGPNAPSDCPSPASHPSMSPAPSPHPTPPPTPPPPNPNLMGPGPHPPGPPLPHPHPHPHSYPHGHTHGPLPPHMHNPGPGGPPPQVMGPHPLPHNMPPGHPHMPPHGLGPRPPFPWEGQGLRDFPPPGPPRGPVPRPPGPGPGPPMNMPGPPGPPVSMHGRFQPPNHHEWERNWNR